jgi:hypothetical protein
MPPRLENKIGEKLDENSGESIGKIQETPDKSKR